ncbi:MAG: DUF3553 domain-containing protein [Candidatus Magnetoovum sp. WYHC-5]|nr:DUF3553 domain-containing protein [Candidatus Magnetoovum sp. WYHC-5]
MSKRLYLKLGDRVKHLNNKGWGTGEVIEEKNSALAGGFCFVKIAFQDGQHRLFINDMDNQCCCYYSGIRII